MSNILKWYTQSDVIKWIIDHLLDYFEKFHQKYITMPIESYNASVTEDSIYISVRILPDFINE